MKNFYRLLLLFGALLIVGINSYLLNDERKSSVPQQRCLWGDRNCEIMAPYQRVRRKAVPRAYRNNFSSDHALIGRQQSDGLRSAFDAEECLDSQDLISAGIKPNFEELSVFCHEHCDGLYSLGCVEEYVTCSDKVPYMMSCPEGLVLDVASSECIERGIVKICKSESPEDAITVSSRLENDTANFLSKNFSCRGLGKSVHSAGCSPISIACVFNESVLYVECPESLKFDVTSQTCQPADQVIECAFKQRSVPEMVPEKILGSTLYRPADTEKPLKLEAKEESEKQIMQSSQLTPALASEIVASHNIIAFSCESMPNGLYGEECATDIVACFEKRAVLTRCPEKFVFNAVSGVCTEKDMMLACDEEHNTVPKVNSGNPAAPTSSPTLQREERTPREEAEASVIDSGSKMDSCKDFRDGIYGTDCSSELFLCVSGEKIPLVICPESEFDIGRATCTPKPENSSCSSGNMTNGEIPVLLQAANALKQLHPAETFDKVTSQVPEKNNEKSLAPSKFFLFTCTDLPDGIYGDTCSKEFYACIGGDAALLRCPSDFLCDAEAKYCKSRETLPQCVEELELLYNDETDGEETESPTITEQPTIIPNQLTSGTTTQATKTVRPIGITGGAPTTTGTPCEYLPDEIYCQECLTNSIPCVDDSSAPSSGTKIPAPEIKQQTPTTRGPAVEIEGKVPEIKGQLPGIKNQAPTAIEFPCEFLHDGNYNQECSQNFTVCMTDNSVLAPATTKTTAKIKGQAPTTTGFPCGFLPDGNYSQECSQNFTACMTNNSVLAPATTTKRPKIKGQAPEINEQILTTTANNSVSVPSKTMGIKGKTPKVKGQKPGMKEQVPEIKNQAPATIDLFCEFLPDGMYSRGCSTHFTGCVAGNSIPMMCPSELKYDELSLQCLAKEDNPTCNGQESESVSLDDEEMVQFKGRPPVVQSSNTVEPPSCGGKADGMYGIGCSGEFYACVGGISIPMRCPGMKKYDESTEQCLGGAYVPACGGTSDLKHLSDATPNSGSSSVIQSNPLSREFSCARLPDGVYVKGCTAEVTLCLSGKLVRYQCPDLLKYDNESMMCLPQSKVEACHDQSPSGKSRSQAPAQAPVPAQISEFTCEDVPDGAYARGCTDEFAVCTSGLTTFYRCPSPLKYDVEAEICRDEEVVSTCDRLTAESSSSSVIDCTNHPDGPVSSGCSSSFQYCVNGELKKHICPGNLKFDNVTEKCISEPLIEACSRTKKPITLSNGEEGEREPLLVVQDVDDQTQAVPVVYLVVRIELSKPTVETTTVFEDSVDEQTTLMEETEAFRLGTGEARRDAASCEGKRNGAYSRGCTSEINVCLGGNNFYLYCKNSLKFDHRSNQCVSAEKVSECRNQILSQSPVFLAAEEAAFNLGQERSAILCAGREDGLYAEECSSEFFGCIEGQAIEMRCPGLQKFDSESKQCLPQRYVKACGATRKALQALSRGSPAFEVIAIREGTYRLIPNGSVQSGTQSASVESELPLGLFPFAPFVTSCIGLPNGKYSRGCSTEFISCIGGKTKLSKCPSNLLKFDSTTQQCSPAAFVKECGGETSKIDAPVLLPDKTVAFETASKEETFGFTCDGQLDGRYAQGCLPEFIQCKGGKDTLLRCPGSLIFDGETQQCRAASYVSACSRQSSSKLLAAPSVSEEVPAQTLAEPLMRTFACKDLPDGIYTHGCSPEFTLCVAGTPLLYHCPGQQMFDAQSEKCLARGLVDSCTERTTEVVTEDILDPEGVEITKKRTDGAISKSSIPVVYSITNLTNLDPTLYFCLGKPDGIYVDDCASDFTVCVAQTTVALHCTNSLKYDEISGTCMDKSDVASCNPSTGTTKNLLSQADSLSKKVSKDPKTQIFGSGDSSAYCADRLDGLYTEGCSSQFISCLLGHGTVYDCPDGLKFDAVLSICAPQDEIAACREGLLITE